MSQRILKIYHLGLYFFEEAHLIGPYLGCLLSLLGLAVSIVILKCLWSEKCFNIIWKITFKIHNSKIWDSYDKNCWFYERVKLSVFTFKNGQETGTEIIAMWRQVVCSGLFTPRYWGEIQRLRKCQLQVIVNRIVSPIYRVVLTKISLFLPFGHIRHTTFWPHDSNTIFEVKIAQLCALVKSTVFILGISNFGIVYFKRYFFIIRGKHFRLKCSLYNYKGCCFSKHYMCISTCHKVKLSKDKTNSYLNPILKFTDWLLTNYIRFSKNYRMSCLNWKV